MLPSMHFEGFPYVLTRIGHTPLRHISLLPADWSRERLVDLTRRQAHANRLDTCLCLSLAEGLYIGTDGKEFTGSLNVWGFPLLGRIHLPEDIPASPELTRRRAALRAFAESYKREGYLVGDGLEGGRRASPGEVKRLRGRDGQGIPRGLFRCPDCRAYRGEYLALKGEGNGDKTPRVVEVHCPCTNHNRCARCGAALNEHRLSAYYLDEDFLEVRYVAAYVGLGHECSGSYTPRLSSSPGRAQLPS